MEPENDGHRSTVTVWISVAFMLIGLLMALIFWGVAFVNDFTNDFRHKLLEEHFSGLVGLPSATTAAFIVVSLFRQGEGPIVIKALGIEIKGAAGPVILWVLCFLAICVGIKLLW